jgi:hypothetical protein
LTSFSDKTNPYSFLQDGTEGGISISGITRYSDSMTFYVDLDMPLNLLISTVSDQGLHIEWSSLRNSTFMIAASSSPENLNPSASPAYSTGDRIGNDGQIVYKGTLKNFSHTGLNSDEVYHYTIWSVIDEENGVYSIPLRGNARTAIHSISLFPHDEDFSSLTPQTLPRGWKAEGGSPQWNIESESSVSIPYSLRINNLGSGAMWFYTPGFQLSLQNKYLISFRYKSIQAPTRESIQSNKGLVIPGRLERPTNRTGICHSIH